MEMRDAEVKGKEIRVPSADKVWMGVWVCLKTGPPEVYGMKTSDV